MLATRKGYITDHPSLSQPDPASSLQCDMTVCVWGVDPDILKAKVKKNHLNFFDLIIIQNTNYMIWRYRFCTLNPIPTNTLIHSWLSLSFSLSTYTFHNDCNWVLWSVIISIAPLLSNLFHNTKYVLLNHLHRFIFKLGVFFFFFPEMDDFHNTIIINLKNKTKRCWCLKTCTHFIKRVQIFYSCCSNQTPWIILVFVHP